MPAGYDEHLLSREMADLFRVTRGPCETGSTEAYLSPSAVLGRALMEQIPPILEARALSIRQSHARARLVELTRRLEALPGRKQSAITEQLYRAIQHLDVETYCAVYTRLTDLYRQQVHLQRRQELLARLERVAPGWAAAIRGRQGVHGQAKLPGDPVVAWRWRQLHDELARRALISVRLWVTAGILACGEDTRC
ncbi:MAG: hypothetical protein PWP72_1812 [Thermoanaerobacter sp.]|nr:hypothetical protein [Thermoanaerobacter sp.]MDN5365241.1 hypothetical protein [Thermacetogenium sp.]